MRLKDKLTGCGTALVTPFSEDGSIDTDALIRNVDDQLAGGIDYLVPCGSTGEAATLNLDEQIQVVETVVKHAGGRVPVVAGAGGYNTVKVTETARAMEKTGADAVLSVSPYYNKPTPDGLVSHYRAIADAISIPVVIYNVPGRTGSNMLPDTVLRIAEIDQVIAIKEASGNMAQITDLLMRRPDGFLVLSGDDAITLPMIALGAEGLISVVANEMPRETADWIHACLAGRFADAVVMQKRLHPLMTANFLETNPIPVKAAMAMMGKIGENYRLPLVRMTEQNRSKMKAVLKSMKLI